MRFFIVSTPATEESAELHLTIRLVTLLSSSIEKFGITNSRAPPAVKPRPTKPGLLRNTGVAIPLCLAAKRFQGVSNSITIKGPSRNLPILSRRVSFFAKPRAVRIRRMSAAAVTNTSSASGAPNVGERALSTSITLASRRGIPACRALCATAAPPPARSSAVFSIPTPNPPSARGREAKPSISSAI